MTRLLKSVSILLLGVLFSAPVLAQELSPQCLQWQDQLASRAAEVQNFAMPADGTIPACSSLSALIEIEYDLADFLEQCLGGQGAFEYRQAAQQTQEQINTGGCR